MFTIKCVNCRNSVNVNDSSKAEILCNQCGNAISVKEEKTYIPRLLIIHGNDKGKEFVLEEPSSSLGRANTNPIQLREPKASRQHARIFFRGGKYYLADMNSGNGTFLNGNPIKQEHILNDKDWLRIGDAVLMFRNPFNYSPVEAVFTDPSPLERTKVERKYDDAHTFLEENQGNVEAVERANKKLRILYEINNAISSVLDLEELLALVMDTVFKYLPAERGAILLCDNDDLRIVTTKIRNGKPDERIKISNTLMERVVKGRSSILTEDTELDDNLKDAPSIILQGVRSAMSVPLISKKNLLGVLHIDTSEKSKQFNEETLELLYAIAGQAAIAIENAQLIKKIEKEIETRGNLQRYLSPELVEQVVNNKIDLNIGGQLKKATLMFTDLRGFTKMTESIGAEAVVMVLNDYFTRMVDIIFSHNGTLDKFMGDAIMATWGLPISRPEDVTSAVRTAIEMQNELFYFNLSQKKTGKNTLRMGIGINTGDVVVGNMGSPRRMEYTVIGPPVNLASRVEHLTGRNHVFITDNSLEECPSVVAIEVETTKVKGIDRPIRVSAGVAIKNEPETDVDTDATQTEGEKALYTTFFPILVKDVNDDTMYEGLLQSYTDTEVVFGTECMDCFQVGASTEFVIDIPKVIPEDRVQVSIAEAVLSMHNTDEYLKIRATVTTLPDSVREFFANLFGGQI